MKIINLIKIFGIAGLMAAAAPSAKANFLMQWPDCNCPPDSIDTVLAQYNFDNVPAGMYSSINPSFASPLVNASGISGPGQIKVGTPFGSTSGQWGCFGGFPANGGAGIISFGLQYNSNTMATFCGLSFDVFREGQEQGVMGPGNFYVDIFLNGQQVWQTEWVPDINSPLQPGFANRIHFDLANPDGNDLDGDGFSFTGNDFSWRDLQNGDKLTFNIRAIGANSSAVGLDLDNVQIHACVVPEPGSAVLLGSVSMLVMLRRRRRA